jgi:CRISPR-associated protein Cas2
MRVIVFFDLPTETNEDKRNYRNFRKTLIKNGFIMLQESVYCRMLITPSAESSLLENIRKNKPPKGIVQILIVTEKQFSKMEYIVGESHSDVIDSDERLIIL